MKKLLFFAACCLAMSACMRKTVQESVVLFDADAFETVIDGKQTSLYTLKAGDLTMQVTNFGGRVVSLWVPDKDGCHQDVVLGYNNIDTYQTILQQIYRFILKIINLYFFELLTQVLVFC